MVLLAVAVATGVPSLSFIVAVAVMVDSPLFSAVNVVPFTEITLVSVDE